MIDKKNILSHFLKLWEKAANAFIALDPETQVELSQFCNRCIQVDLKNTDMCFFVFFTEESIQLLEEYDDIPNVKLFASPLSLAQLVLTQGDSGIDSQASIDMEGDIAFAQKIRSVMGRMDVDWEELLAKLFGDIAAHKMGLILSKGYSLGSDQSKLVLETVSDCLLEESQMLVGRHEVEFFLRSVDTLQNDVERCQARVQQLSNEPC